MSVGKTVEVAQEVVEKVQEVTKTSNETVHIVMRKLEAVASSLGTTVKYLWGIMVKQATVLAVMDALCLVGVCILAYGYYKFVKYASMSKWYEGYNSQGSWVLTVVLSVVMVALFLLAVALIPEMTTCIVNPEYWAFKEIIKEIR
jgi:uncharacterized membrane protein YidH (DUF202 family)